MNLTIPKSALLLVAILSLQACAAPKPAVYGPIGEKVPHGYKERLNPDGGYTLLVIMPPYSPLSDGHAFWDRRAAELCPGGLAKRIVFRAERKQTFISAGYVYGGASVSSRAVTAFEVEGYVYCKAMTSAPMTGARVP